MNDALIMLHSKVKDSKDLLLHLDMHCPKEDALLIRTMLNEVIDLFTGVEVYMKKKQISP